MIEPIDSGQKTFTARTPARGYGNFTATVAPTVNDDLDLGYSVNSIWYKSSVPPRLWVCTDASDGAAVWKEERLAGWQTPITVQAASVGLLASFAGATYENTGATALVVLTLPTVYEGLEYSAYVADADGIKFLATDSKVIQNGVTSSAANGFIQSTTIGSFITIRGVAGKWIVQYFTGSWTLT